MSAIYEISEGLHHYYLLVQIVWKHASQSVALPRYGEVNPDIEEVAAELLNKFKEAMCVKIFSNQLELIGIWNQKEQQ